MSGVPNSPGADLGIAMLTAMLHGDSVTACQLAFDCDDMVALKGACGFLAAVAEGALVSQHGRGQAIAYSRYGIIQSDPDAHP